MEYFEDLPRSIPVIPVDVWFSLDGGANTSKVFPIYLTVPPKIGDRFVMNDISAKVMGDDYDFREWVITSIDHEIDLTDRSLHERPPLAVLKIVVKPKR